MLRRWWWWRWFHLSGCRRDRNHSNYVPWCRRQSSGSFSSVRNPADGYCQNGKSSPAGVSDAAQAAGLIDVGIGKSPERFKTNPHRLSSGLNICPSRCRDSSRRKIPPQGLRRLPTEEGVAGGGLWAKLIGDGSHGWPPLDPESLFDAMTPHMEMPVEVIAQVVETMFGF